MLADKSSNVVWQETEITKERRNNLNNHKSVILWFTGLSGSGKSTIANTLEVVLHRLSIRTYLLDGDNIRHGLNKDLGFSDTDRTENIRRIGEVAKLFIDSGTMALTTFISPFRDDRKIVRDLVEEKDFVEIYVQCPLDVCEQRDVKGLYERARKGEIKKFTGIDSPYESPINPEITIDTSVDSVDDAVNKILSYLIKNSYVQLRRKGDKEKLFNGSLQPMVTTA